MGIEDNENADSLAERWTIEQQDNKPITQSRLKDMFVGILWIHSNNDQVVKPMPKTVKKIFSHKPHKDVRA